MNYKKIFIIDGNLHVFRDDLYPFLGGGNKGRKMDFIGEDVLKQGANALVTTGGIQSNHCRAVALFAAMNKMKCSLILHGDKNEFYRASGNAKIMRDSGVDIIFSEDAEFISELMNEEMLRYDREGFKPYYIWGGGHTYEGGNAYIQAVKDLVTHCNECNWYPEFIFHASGTGSTQAGILAGLDKFNIESKVIGISVGRNSAHAEKVVGDFYRELCSHYQIKIRNNDVVVLDDYLCGGYGLFNEEIKRLSANSIRDFGFTLDTCYTAKAFYGMQEYIMKNNLENRKILFWHTGGLLNYLAE